MRDGADDSPAITAGPAESEGEEIERITYSRKSMADYLASIL